ncbi:hypothetical protein N483_14085 [Pseudoalteromonas luteoviolacea NCIMB 1944]|nr:hypothetical protein N483_14085 [Pseudoalteromonas luteoviolacea NCIMB 1944]
MSKQRFYFTKTQLRLIFLIVALPPYILSQSAAVRQA